MATSSSLVTAKAVLSAVGSIAATVVVVRGVAQDFLTHEFYEHIFSGIRTFLSRFSNQLTMVIDEFDGLVTNEIYQAAETYLGPKVSPTTRRFKISKPDKEKNYNITMERGEEIVDVYNGEKFKWVWNCRTTGNTNLSMRTEWEVRSFELTFHKKNRDLAISSYMPYIVNKAKIKKQEKRTIKIFTVDYENLYNINDMWTPVTFDHPATFETLAMDSDQKEMILKDLERFLKRREYYRKVGKAWKRGYLLYGPPGTGKSSLIASMANYLNFDVYDLELAQLKRNSDLRKLLVATANKSILVVEDIDCSIDLQEKLASRDTSSTLFYDDEKSQVTLSGLLNFVDGLWSTCGDERIIIFTTNHVEKLDAALLRPGRMDVHINMSYCTPCGFRLLASNYLGIKDHVLFEEIEDLIKNGKATPAEVAEQLLRDDDPDVSLRGLLDFLHKKIKEDEDQAEAEKGQAVADNQENVKQEESMEINVEKKEDVISQP